MKHIKKLSLSIAVLFFAVVIQAQTPVDSLFGKNEQAGKYFDSRGFKMYYETYGSGEPLLIIHGNGGSIKDFTNQVPFLRKIIK